MLDFSFAWTSNILALVNFLNSDRAKHFRRCFPQHSRTCMRGYPLCHVRLNTPVRKLREHFGVLESTETSSVPTEMLMQRPMSKSHQLLQSRGLKTILSDTRTALWCMRFFLRYTSHQISQVPRFHPLTFKPVLSGSGTKCAVVGDLLYVVNVSLREKRYLAPSNLYVPNVTSGDTRWRFLFTCSRQTLDASSTRSAWLAQRDWTT